jgi:hypothetical protein
VKYALQNLEQIIQYVTGKNLSMLNLLIVNRYGGPTALTLLAIILFLFHGLRSWSPVITWLPVFVSVTLLATVNLAPGLSVTVAALGDGLLALIALGGPIRTPRAQAMDVEQARDPLPGMSEPPTFDYRRYRSTDSIQSFIQHLPEVRNPELHDQGIDESVELDINSISTTTEIRLLMQHLDPVPDLAPQYIALAPIGQMDEQSVCFPQAPHNHLLEVPFSRDTSSSRVEEPSLELLVPE